MSILPKAFTPVGNPVRFTSALVKSPPELLCRVSVWAVLVLCSVKYPVQRGQHLQELGSSRVQDKQPWGQNLQLLLVDKLQTLPLSYKELQSIG